MTPERRREIARNWYRARKDDPAFRAHLRELQRAEYARNPEMYRAASRRWYAKKSQDPEWREKQRQRQRLAYWTQPERQALYELGGALAKAGLYG